MRSLDWGSNWVQVPLPASVGMVQDLNFFDASKGLLFAGIDADTERLRALILLTQYGGVGWHEVYRSTRPFELIQEASFPTRGTGFATVQSFKPNTPTPQHPNIATRGRKKAQTQVAVGPSCRG